MNTALERTIVALDNMNQEQIESFVEKQKNDIGFYKVGMQTFYRYGKDFFYHLHDKFNVQLFLDLKLHDIPNTVAGAIESLQGLPIKFLTLHLSGGVEMCKAAVEAKNKFLPNTKIIGVSLLTSLGQTQLNDIFSYTSTQQKDEMIQRLSQIAKISECDGMVCSAHEASSLSPMMTICPGIRFADEISEQKVQDQARVMTPRQAVEHGAHYLVIGRSLTKAKNITSRIAELRKIKAI